VSDVTPLDIGHLFNSLSNPAYFEQSRHSSLEFLIERLTRFYSDGRIIIRPHDFWTTQHSYWRLPQKAPDLLSELEESDLLIFKGDLNYRKYVSVSWDVGLFARANLWG
jgi:damage-control phosphatase, subfamily III